LWLILIQVFWVFMSDMFFLLYESRLKNIKWERM
jgi:hypothetical protein